MTQYRPTTLGTLASNTSIGPFLVRDFMALDSGVLSIVGDVQTSGAGTVTVEYYVDSTATLGGSSGDTMNTASGYILHKVVSPDLYFKLTMTGRDTDDIDFHAT